MSISRAAQTVVSVPPDYTPKDVFNSLLLSGGEHVYDEGMAGESDVVQPTGEHFINLVSFSSTPSPAGRESAELRSRRTSSPLDGRPPRAPHSHSQSSQSQYHSDSLAHSQQGFAPTYASADTAMTPERRSYSSKLLGARSGEEVPGPLQMNSPGLSPIPGRKSARGGVEDTPAPGMDRKRDASAEGACSSDAAAPEEEVGSALNRLAMGVQTSMSIDLGEEPAPPERPQPALLSNSNSISNSGSGSSTTSSSGNSSSNSSADSREEQEEAEEYKLLSVQELDATFGGSSVEYGLEQMQTLADSFVAATPPREMYSHRHAGTIGLGLDSSLQSLSLLPDGTPVRQVPSQRHAARQQEGGSNGAREPRRQQAASESDRNQTPHANAAAPGNMYSIAFDSTGTPMLVPVQSVDTLGVGTPSPGLLGFVGTTPEQRWGAHYGTGHVSESPHALRTRPFHARRAGVSAKAALPSSYWKDRLAKRNLGSVMMSPFLSKY